MWRGSGGKRRERRLRGGRLVFDARRECEMDDLHARANERPGNDMQQHANAQGKSERSVLLRVDTKRMTRTWNCVGNIGGHDQRFAV